MIPAVMTGRTIVCGQGQQPDRADQKSAHPDEQPGHEAEVAEPLWSGKDPRKLSGIDLYELGGVPLSVSVALSTSQPDTCGRSASH